MTHDYKRHGTTTLFAALNVLEGKVIGRCMQRHRHQEFIRFLNDIAADILPFGKGVHVILDNYAAHKHAKVRAWLGRHERFTFDFDADLLLLAQCRRGLLRESSRSWRLRRGVFRSMVDLEVAINRFLDETNDNPKPFTWTADPDKIIAAVKRAASSVRFDPLAYKKSCEPVPTSTVHSILRNRLYTGWPEWNGKLYQGKHEPLVSIDMWERVQGVMDGSERQQAPSHDP